MTLLDLRRRIDIKIHRPLESLRFQMHMMIITHIKPQVHALVDGEARHQSMLVVHMRSQRTYPVGREDMI